MTNDEKNVKEYQRVEQIYVCKDEKGFSIFFARLSTLIYLGSMIAMCVVLRVEKSFFVKNMDMFFGLLFVFVVVILSATMVRKTATRIAEHSKTYGFALVATMDSSKLFVKEKELYYIANETKIYEQSYYDINSSSETENRQERRAYRKWKDEILCGYHELLKSEQFRAQVEEEINHPNDSIEGWQVTPMRDAKLGRAGFWGTKIFFRERRGTQKSCIISRDFPDYKEIQNLIKNMNES